jgi:hypothetical protein
MDHYLKLYVLYWVISSMLIYFAYERIKLFFSSIKDSFVSVVNMGYCVQV